MTIQLIHPLADLYEKDETAWLEAMSDLIRAGNYEELDLANLGEYLQDMARRDKREVRSRLAILIAHLLKWEYQPERRSGSWLETITHQQQELRELLESGLLRNHADDILATAYADGAHLAEAETGLPGSTFPKECPRSVDEWLVMRPAD